MGYSAYWDATPGAYESAAFSKFVARVGDVLGAAPVSIAGPDGNGAPLLTGDLVSLNGAPDEMCETLYIPRVVVADDNPSQVFNSCKTAWQPYDVVATAILLLYRHHFPDAVTLSSDGEPAEWEPGRDLVKAACGFAPEIVFSESS
jgi:hypothetical protein